MREDAVRSLHGFEAVVLVAPSGHDVHSVAEVAGRPGELEDKLLGRSYKKKLQKIVL